MTNILIALKNIINSPSVSIKNNYSPTGHNRANNMGEALELYMKDAFCNTFGKTATIRNTEYSNNFSYLGNQNNPPDIIIKKGDAIEVKKIENVGSQIALNSSYPKDKLYSNSPMITQACKQCEDWKKKDIVYIIGATPNGKLKTLWLVYGDCYAASRKTYERIKTTIATGINSLPDVEFSDTKELGRINKVDPLGITYLRIRGMWGIDNPSRITKDIYDKKCQEYNDKLQLLNIEISEHTKANYDYQTTVASVLNVASRAKEIFDSSEITEKRQFLNYLLQNPTVNDKTLEFTMRSPFNLVLELATSPSWLRE